MSTILFEDKNLTIFFYEDKEYLLLRWNGFLDSKNFRSLATKVLESIDKTGTQKILSDNSNWKVITPNDHGWAANTWFPRAEKKGIKFLATVLSSDYFNRAAERAIEGLADIESMQIRNFQSHDDALSWLSKNSVASSRTSH